MFDISVLICTRNRADDLAETLQALASLRIPVGLKTETLIIDNGSRDHTGEVVENFKGKIPNLRREISITPGLARARNAAVANCSGQVLLFTDDDVRPGNGWIEEMSTPIRAGLTDAISGGVRLHESRRRPWMTRFHLRGLAETDPPEFIDIPTLTGANMALSRDIFRRIGGFDPELGVGALGFHEEELLAAQIRTSGGTILSRPHVVVDHLPTTDRYFRAAWLRMAYHRARSEAYVDHHWRHIRVKQFYRYWVRAWAQLRQYRLANRHLDPYDEGIDPHEFERVHRFSYIKEVGRWRKQPRFYNKYGLHKIRGERPRMTPIMDRRINLFRSWMTS